jgi:hypothetical protein
VQPVDCVEPARLESLLELSARTSAGNSGAVVEHHVAVLQQAARSHILHAGLFTTVSFQNRPLSLCQQVVHCRCCPPPCWS